MRFRQGRAKNVTAGPARHRGSTSRFQQPRPTRRRLLRRRCLRAVALSRLPGLVARLAHHIPKAEDLPHRPRAAVAVVLAQGPDSVLVIRRAERADDRWSGQLAFPGGRWDRGDADLGATARRETTEEVGLDLSSHAVVAVLDDLAPRTPLLPPILVRPFVFIVPQQQPLYLNHEVAGAWWVPLESFLAPGSLGLVEFPRYGTLVRSIGYQLEIGVLWGMSERILTPLLQMFPPRAPNS